MTSVVDSIFGGDDSADAAEEAAELQLQGTREAIADQKESRAQTREDLRAFREFGAGQIGGLSDNLNAIQNLVFDPNQQVDFLQNNPFFKALTDDAERRIFNRAAASGRSLSGGTAEALQNSILLLGNDLLNQDVQRKTGVTQLQQGAVNTGLNAAAQTGAFGQNATNAITSLTTQGANALAAGEVGAANAIQTGRNNAINTGLGVGTILALSDENEKDILADLGKHNGVPYYLFKYKGSNKVELGTIAQEVEHIPGAVVNIGGKKYVDYGVLNGN